MTETIPEMRSDDANREPSARTDLPVYECARCGRPFAREEWLALHRGLAHPDDLSEAEIEAFRTAHDSEAAALRRFRLEALGALVVLYFGLLLVYAVV